MYSKSLLLLPFLTGLALAQANDWSSSCLDGQCSYTDKSGTQITITGSPNAISDVTEAGGWLIVECDAKATTQSMRVVCQDEQPESNCNHLFSNGAKGTVVRLPERCSAAAFALVTDTYPSRNQEMPKEISSRVTRTGGRPATVYNFDVTTDFTRGKAAHQGTVAFTLNTLDSSGPMIGRDMFERSVIDEKHSFSPMNFEKEVTLYHDDFECNSPEPYGVDIGAKFGAQAQTHVGLYINGTVIPPKINELYGYLGVDGTIGGNLTFEFAGEGKFSSHEPVTVFNYSTKAVGIPGIITVAPGITLATSASGEVSGSARVNMGLNLLANNMKLHVGWRDSAPEQDEVFTITNSHLGVAAGDQARIHGVTEAHLVVRTSFDVKAFGAELPVVYKVHSDNALRAKIDVRHDNKVADTEVLTSGVAPSATSGTTPSSIPEKPRRSIAGRLFADAPGRRATTAPPSTAKLAEQFCVDVKYRLSLNPAAGENTRWNNLMNKCVVADVGEKGSDDIQITPGLNSSSTPVVDTTLNSLCHIPMRSVTIP